MLFFFFHIFEIYLQKLMTEMEEGWAVCCIHRKKAKSKRRSTTGAKNGNTTRKVAMGKIRASSSITTDMATRDDSGPPQPSSPSCSSDRDH